MSTDWRARAACRDYEPEWWFPLDNHNRSRADGKAALDICRECPVRQQCLAWALETRESYGIWGGKTEDQRARLLGTKLSQLRLLSSRTAL